MSADPAVTPPTADTPDAETLAALADVALEIGTRCGRLIRDERPADLGVAATKSSATDVVTAMDTASERLAREIVARRRPGDGFYGEEGDPTGSETGLTWVVDPIDGTVNYLYGHPMYAVSVAAVVGDPSADHGYRPVVGVVVAPALREAYAAVAGQGAQLLTLDDDLTERSRSPLCPEPPAELGQTLLATGFGYLAEKRAWQGRVVAGMLPQVRDIRRGGSAALDLSWVAAGRLDAYAEHGLQPWDAAAGRLLVEEAGGVATDLDGAAPTRAWTIAGGAHVVPVLREALVDLGARDEPVRQDDVR